MESEQRIIVAADVSWQTCATDRSIEHPTERWSVDRSCLHAKATMSEKGADIGLPQHSIDKLEDVANAGLQNFEHLKAETSWRE
jgi:hypothetical protein